VPQASPRMLLTQWAEVSSVQLSPATCQLKPLVLLNAACSVSIWTCCCSVMQGPQGVQVPGEQLDERGVYTAEQLCNPRVRVCALVGGHTTAT
jgi:hypothetical protein